MKIDMVKISGVTIERITDENGIHWYPFSYFMEKVLFKEEKASVFVRSTMRRYFKLIEYSCDRAGMSKKQKIWCIKESGIKYLLRHIEIKLGKSIDLYFAREKGYYEACKYFHIKPKEIRKPLFINHFPRNTKIDFWSRLCLENDYLLTSDSTWKRCFGCNYYYPYYDRYFGKNKRYNSKCLQCQGKNFKCLNKTYQFLYDKGGAEILYQVTKKKPDTERLLREMKKLLGKDEL